MDEGVSGHFQDLEQQQAAGRLGMMVFIASEIMLFAGMFGLYFAYRIAYPGDFAHGVAGNLRWAGSLNTYLLLISSWCMAMALARLRTGLGGANLFIAAAMLLGSLFLGIKSYEYLLHVSDRLVPGATTHSGQGSNAFIALYFLMTGIHALHIIVGLVLIVLAWPRAARGHPHRLEVAALYWHFTDLMWVFIWPLFYLLGRSTP